MSCFSVRWMDLVWDLVLLSNLPIIAVCVFLYNMIVKLIKRHRPPQLIVEYPMFEIYPIEMNLFFQYSAVEEMRKARKEVEKLKEDLHRAVCQKVALSQKLEEWEVRQILFSWLKISK